MSDPIGAIMAALAADPDVTARTAGRIFGGELPADETRLMPRGALVVQDAGGLGVFGGGYLPYGDMRIDLVNYGPSPRDAYLLHRATRDRLRTLRREVHGGMLLHWARQAGGLGQDRVPETRWPVFVTTWQVLVDDRQVI